MAVLLPMVALYACASDPSQAEEESGTSRNYNAQIGIVNHTNQLIYSASGDGNGGGHSSAFNAGVANICCVTLPRQWFPGLKFEVNWDVPIGREHVAKSKVVEVESYSEPSSLYLHFFPNDEVRIVVARWIGSSLKHPIAPPPRR